MTRITPEINSVSSLCRRFPYLRATISLFLAATLTAQQLPPMQRAVTLDNSVRIHDLLRAGSINLSLQDALALAIENNLDIELQRFTIPQGDTEFLRAQGGGITRGLNYTLSEVPTGVGGPLSPLVTNPAATGSATNGTSVPSNALELGTLGEPQTNYSMQGTVAQSNGTAVPVFDPAIVGQLNWNHQTTPVTTPTAYGTPSLVTQGFTANAGVQQGFMTGGRRALTSITTTSRPTRSTRPTTPTLAPASDSTSPSLCCADSAAASTPASSASLPMSVASLRCCSNSSSSRRSTA